MNNHPHPPRARAEKRLSLSKKWTKEARKKKAFHERARGNITHNCLSTIFSRRKFPILNTENYRKTKLFFGERREKERTRGRIKSRKNDTMRERERDDIFVLLRRVQKKITTRTATNESEEELGIQGNIFSRSPCLNFFCFGKVFCVSLFLSSYYEGAAAVGRV